MDRYRILKIGREFIVTAGDVSVLKCPTKRRAEATIAAALNLFDHPVKWQITMNKRGAKRNVARFSSKGSKSAHY